MSETITKHRYLRVQDLRRLRNLLFAPRRVVEGLYAGRHASPQRGHSVEFTDYREYAPGDEIIDIDWKVYGRSDKLFIKLFEHQSDMTVHLLVDASASMAFSGCDEASRASGPSWLGGVSLAARKRQRRAEDAVWSRPSKFDQACLLAASIALLTVNQQDKVGFAVAQHGLRRLIRPGGSFAHLHHLLTEMEQVQPERRAGLAAAIDDLSRRVSRRVVLVILSDLMEDAQTILRALAQFTHRGSEVIVFHILHQEELRLPNLGEARFIDSESGQRLRMNVDDIRSQYQRKIRQFVDGWTTALQAAGVDHNLVSTATAYYQALERYMYNRAALLRGPHP